jgi:spore germination protein KB
MEIQQISARNLRGLLVMMVLCGSLISGTLTTAQDNWLSVLLIGVLFLPLLLIYSGIAALFPGKNLYDIIQILFGPVAGFLMIFFMTAYAWPFLAAGPLSSAPSSSSTLLSRCCSR